MVGLLDVNVLVALLVPEHEHHPAAMSWFASQSGQGWATCSVTELGVIRVCAQLPGGIWAPEETADRLLLLTAASRAYVFWPDSTSPAVMPEVRSAATAKQITDRYLLGLARRYGGRLITFDRPLAAAGGDDAFCLLSSEADPPTSAT